MNNIGTKLFAHLPKRLKGFGIVMNSIGTKFPEITEL